MGISDRKEEEKIIPFPSLRVHFSICAPAEQQESGDDEKTTGDCSTGKRLANKEPVRNSDKEDGETSRKLSR